jgi:hypothetical protein
MHKSNNNTAKIWFLKPKKQNNFAFKRYQLIAENQTPEPNIYLDDFELIAEVSEVFNLRDLFSFSQDTDKDWAANDRVTLNSTIKPEEVRSTKVGDLFEINNKYFLVCGKDIYEVFPKQKLDISEAVNNNASDIRVVDGGKENNIEQTDTLDSIDF